MRSRITKVLAVTIIAILVAWILTAILKPNSVGKDRLQVGSKPTAIRQTASPSSRPSQLTVPPQTIVANASASAVAEASSFRELETSVFSPVEPSGFSITGRISIEGDLPSERPLPLDDWCAKAFTEAAPNQSPTTQFYVTDNGGLGDVLVTLVGVEDSPLPEKAAPHEVRATGCQFEPYISACRARQQIIFSNHDPVLHTFIAAPEVDGNEPFTLAQIPESKGEERSFSETEEFLRIKSDTRPWMFAYISVLDHPYFDVSQPNGEFNIRGVPPGQYSMKARHRKIGEIIKEIEITNETLQVDFTFLIE